MKLLGIDFETTGLNPDTDKIIEVGAVVYDIKEKKPLKAISEVISHPGCFIPDDIKRLTGINEQIIAEFGIPFPAVMGMLDAMSEKCEYLVAFNAEFEKSFIAKSGFTFATLDRKKWIDPMVDVDFPDSIKTRKLDYLCYEHGFKNPFSHRAVFDVMAMFKVMENYSIEKTIERSESPMIEVSAGVSFDERDKAKEKYFIWNSDRKIWTKKVKKIDFDKLKSECNFPIKIISF